MIRVQMASRDVSDGESHRENSEPERQSDAGESNSDCGKSGGQHGGAASTKHQPEGSNEFRCDTFTNRRGDLLKVT